MGRIASCGDNAAMESFFSLLQKNVLNRRSGATQEELRLAIVTWIERTYHRRRRQARLCRLTPDRIRGRHEYDSRTGCVTRNCHQPLQRTPTVQSGLSTLAVSGSQLPPVSR